ncbi:MAG: ABC transporter permease subunit [Nocardioidaceae bacterium]|nr:ABC transporter permease subunit [Nocardioidaceae bacterium]
MRGAGLLGRSLLTLWFLLPVLGVVVWAGADEWRSPATLPTDWGLRGWHQSWDQDMAPALLRSAVLSLLVATLATPLGAAAARWLSYTRSPTRSLVAAIMLAPVFLPPFALVLGSDVILLRLQMPALAGVVLVLTVLALPYTTYVMLATYQSYDPGYDDEARTLGASAVTALVRVHLPLVMPGIVTAWFLALLVGWSDYVVTLVIGGGLFVTAPLLVAAQASGTGNEPAVAALVVVTVVPPLVLAVLVSRLRPRITLEA